jgi:hypothetical protein
MGKLNIVLKLIAKMRDEGLEPQWLLMSKPFAIALKEELMPDINKYFKNGRMEVDGVPWKVEKIRGFRVEYLPKGPVTTE